LWEKGGGTIIDELANLSLTLSTQLLTAVKLFASSVVLDMNGIFDFDVDLSQGLDQGPPIGEYSS
jgi:hypothetical protein